LYYDFHTSEDGTLTIAVGDATGHGLKAGTMVAAVKSLFVTLAYHPDLPHIFTRLSQTLKQMNLRGLFMALTVAKVKENRLTISLAGMPPVWIYRATTQQIEEVALKQFGGVTKYVYQQCEYELASGDVVVLLSDGLPERFNAQGAMLEEAAVQAFIAGNAQLSAQGLLEGLAKLGDDWGGARAQDDDVTFVVLKVR
jgi:serine phosphatase RsbU (regulator of sigma subunit)